MLDTARPLVRHLRYAVPRGCGKAVAACWDGALAAAMQHAGRAVAEEALFEHLQPELGNPASGAG